MLAKIGFLLDFLYTSTTVKWVFIVLPILFVTNKMGSGVWRGIALFFLMIHVEIMYRIYDNSL
jgi:hypothetical protein